MMTVNMFPRSLRVPVVGAFVAVLVAFQVHLVCGETLDYDRVHLVDRSSDNRNWLFRGNFPGGPNGTYAYATLLDYLHKRAVNATGASLPEHFEFRVISLLNIFDKGFYIEKDFYDNNPSKANLTVWTIAGGLLPPQYLDNSTRQKIVNDPDLLFVIDQLPSRIEQAHEWIHGSSESPQVIYWHCEGGCDRTGEISGAYNIKFKGFNVTAAYDLNTKDCGRPENFWSTNMLGWYCLYYENQTGKDAGDCLNFSN